MAYCFYLLLFQIPSTASATQQQSANGDQDAYIEALKTEIQACEARVNGLLAWSRSLEAEYLELVAQNLALRTRREEREAQWAEAEPQKWMGG